MATHRADVDMSAQYKPMEDVFIQIGKGQKDDPVYKMNSAEKDCLDTFMMAKGLYIGDNILKASELLENPLSDNQQLRL